MTDKDLNEITLTQMKGGVPEFKVSSELPDGEDDTDETVWDFPDAAENLGHYLKIPELKRAIDSLATWTVGKGWSASDSDTVLMENFVGWGEDTAQSIFWNLQVQKKVFGNAFAELIRNDDGEIVNIKPLYPGDMRVVVDKNGIIKRYEHGNGANSRKLPPYKILHLVNDRIGNQIHGTSVIPSVKWVIEARKEAMEDWRRISHRSTIRLMYIDEDDTTRLATVRTNYKEAIKKGELMIIPAKKQEAEMEDLSSPPVQNFLEWIRYLENFFYQAVGIPRVIATSENFTEAASKVGYITFEPIYSREQVDFEGDLRQQALIKIKFNRPPSLTGAMQESEEKNTGQTGFQDSESQVTERRVE